MRRAGALIVALVTVAGCGGQPPAAEPTPHGYVAGAEETAEPQHRLVLADNSRVHVLDPVTGRVTEAGRAHGITGIEEDGRFAYVAHGEGALRVVDGGGWTVDHGDHVHHYRAAPRDLGTVPGRRALAGAGLVAVSGDGGTRLLDRARMEKGEIAQIGSVPYGSVLPFNDRLYAVAGGGVEMLSRDGSPVGRVGEECRDAHPAGVTRRGAVFTCADGALLIGRDGPVKIVPGENASKGDERTARDQPVDKPAPDRASGEAVPGRADEDDGWGSPGRVGALRGRAGSAVLAGAAPNGGVWVLDLAERTWRFLDAGPVTAVIAAGPEEPVLVLDPDGVLHAWDPVTGDHRKSTRLLKEPDDRAVIEVDTARAYVSDPAARAVHEIDYRDGLRRARTFDLGFTPAHLVETGR